MSGKLRSRLEVTAEILTALENGEKQRKSWLLSQANLTAKGVNRHIATLQIFKCKQCHAENEERRRVKVALEVIADCELRRLEVRP